MKLEKSDKEAIADVLAVRYFSEKGWKWLNLRFDVGKLYRAFEELEDQYASYPDMGRDWYVSNSATYNLHMCDHWEEFTRLIEFLRYYDGLFNFFVISNGKISFCITDFEGQMTSEHKTAVYQARKAGYNVYIFHTEVPDSMDFKPMYLGGAV